MYAKHAKEEISQLFKSSSVVTQQIQIKKEVTMERKQINVNQQELTSTETSSKHPLRN
jgi:hypothetical protein